MSTEMNAIMKDLESRTYGIVYTADYRRLIRLMIADLNRRGIAINGSYEEFLADDKVNTYQVADYIFSNIRKYGYPNQERYDVVNADQMHRAQAHILEKSKDILVK